MLYVPIIVPPHSPSPQTRELADRLLAVIRDYEQQHPTVTRPEVREATRMAAQRAGGAGPATGSLAAAAVGAGLLALLGTLLLLRSGASGGVGLEEIPVLLIVAVLAVVGLGIFAAKRGP